MIKEFVNRFDKNKDVLRKRFEQEHPSYKDIVKHVIEVIVDENDHEYLNPDPNVIYEIDDGDYQGTLLYIIPEATYQPCVYWAVRVDYGSCSSCDTLQNIQAMDFGEPTKEQVDQYMILALHIVQGLKEI